MADKVNLFALPGAGTAYVTSPKGGNIGKEQKGVIPERFPTGRGAVTVPAPYAYAYFQQQYKYMQ